MHVLPTTEQPTNQQTNKQDQQNNTNTVHLSRSRLSHNPKANGGRASSRDTCSPPPLPGDWGGGEEGGGETHVPLTTRPLTDDAAVCTRTLCTIKQWPSREGDTCVCPPSPPPRARPPVRCRATGLTKGSLTAPRQSQQNRTHTRRQDTVYMSWGAYRVQTAHSRHVLLQPSCQRMMQAAAAAARLQPLLLCPLWTCCPLKRSKSTSTTKGLLASHRCCCCCHHC